MNCHKQKFFWSDSFQTSNKEYFTQCLFIFFFSFRFFRKRPANKPLPIFEIPFNFHFSVKCGLNVHRKMGLGQVGICFYDEFTGQLPLLGKRFRAMGGPGCEKVNPCHLYDFTLLILSGILGRLRTFERKLGHLRTWAPFFALHLI